MTTPPGRPRGPLGGGPPPGPLGDGPFPDAAWLESARRRWSDPTFTTARTALDARCAAHHDRRPPVPDRQAGYYHEYFCPDHAVQLIYDPLEPGHHACPVDGHVYTGEPFDGARLWSVNDQLSDAALWLAFRAAIDPAARSAPGDRALAGRILLDYAAVYTTLTTTSNRADGYDGIATFSALDESVWVIRLAWAFGLLGDSLTVTDRELVRTRLFAPAAVHLWKVRWPEIHNVSVWNASALIALAIVLGDSDALGRAVDAPLGLRDQLTQGVRPDGLWWEVSLSYHYYTLAAAIWGARSLRAIGRPLDDDGTLSRMFRGPLALMLPDLSLPAVNDCWYHIGLTGEVGHGIPDAAGFLEVGYGWTGDEGLGWALEHGATGRSRSALEALLDGRADLPASAGPPTFPLDQTLPSGLAVLRGGRRGSLDEVVAILKAGPGARDHGHPDQLAIQLFGGRGRLLDDLGTAGYGIPLNESWYRATAGHSTIVIGGASQPLADGRITHLIDEGDWSMAEGLVEWPTDATEAYAGASARRQVILADGYVIDIMEVTCVTPRTIDWVILPHGTLVAAGIGGRDAQPGRAAGGGVLETGGGGIGTDGGVLETGRGVLVAHRRVLGTAAGLEMIDGVVVLDEGAPMLAWTRPDGARLHAFLAPAGGPAREAWYGGTAPGNPAFDRLSVLVRRRTAAFARFVAVLVPGRVDAPGSVTAVAWSTEPGGGDDTEIAVTTPGGVARWVVGRGAPRLQRR